jgi:hypothetical protein
MCLHDRIGTSMGPSLDFVTAQRLGRVGSRADVKNSPGERASLLASALGSTLWCSGSCAYRKSRPAILMVQSAQDRVADDIPGPLDAARDRGILVQ